MLPPDHPARAVVAFAARLDLSPLLNVVRSREGTRGHLDIDLAILVTPRLYATIDGVDSAREPERLRELNLPYQWLCGGVGVNYHTLADARLNCDAWLNTTLTASRAEAGELACGRRILQSRGGDEAGEGRTDTVLSAAQGACRGTVGGRHGNARHAGGRGFMSADGGGTARRAVVGGRAASSGSMPVIVRGAGGGCRPGVLRKS